MLGKMSRAIFLDRDGVINKAIWNPVEKAWDSPYRMEDFELLPGVPEAIRKIRSLGFLSIVISNQPGMAKRKCDRTFLDYLTKHMVSQLELDGAHIDDVFYCLHHPEAVVESLRAKCQCRKPKPGLLFEAAQKHGIDLRNSFFIGDQEKDVEAGLQAGCITVRLGNQEALFETMGHMTADNLGEAVAKIQESLQVKETR